jgi:hypothetical protein
MSELHIQHDKFTISRHSRAQLSTEVRGEHTGVECRTFRAGVDDARLSQTGEKGEKGSEYDMAGDLYGWGGVGERRHKVRRSEESSMNRPGC